MEGKRKTLPNHFDVLIKTGSLEEQIDVMKKCIPNAVDEVFLQRLAQLCVEWVLKNPGPIAMVQPPYRR